MKKQLVEKFTKKTNTHIIRLVAGIDPDPPDPHSNTMFYIRMESEEKETGEICKVEPIWLSLNQMVKLSVLMTIASKFWEKTLEKGSWESWKKTHKFIDLWEQVSDSIDALLEEK